MGELPDLRPLAGYVRATFAPEDDLLRDLVRAAAEEGLPEIQITAEVGRLLQVFARAVGARRVLEIGTLGGYSAIWLARALPADGRLVTLEISPDRAAFARAWIARSDVAGRIEVREGAALDLLPLLAAGPPFDLVFIDADKESYPAYLDWSLKLLRPGGAIAADNVLFSPSWKSRITEPDPLDPAVRGVREFNRALAAHPRLTSVAVAIREGVALAVLGE
jgi:predicted O-methyltransferase YrrM